MACSLLLPYLYLSALMLIKSPCSQLLLCGDMKKKKKSYLQDLWNTKSQAEWTKHLFLSSDTFFFYFDLHSTCHEEFPLTEAKTVTLIPSVLSPSLYTLLPRKLYWHTPHCTSDIYSTILRPLKSALHQHHWSLERSTSTISPSNAGNHCLAAFMAPSCPRSTNEWQPAIHPSKRLKCWSKHI